MMSVNQSGAPVLNDVLERLMPTNPSSAAPPKFTTRALSLSIPIYYLVDATDRERKAVMTAMTLSGRANEDAPIKWQSWVLTWSCLVFPELVAVIRDSGNQSDYRLEQMDRTFVTACVNAILEQSRAETAGDKYIAFPSGLPDPTLVPMTAEVAQTASSIEGLYAYYAMVVFILGKSLNQDVMSSISTKRPDALIRKRQLYTSEYILKGDGRIPQENYAKVQGGWVRSTVPRQIIVTHLAVLYA